MTTTPSANPGSAQHRPSADERDRFGNHSTHELRVLADRASPQLCDWLAGLATALEIDGYERLNDTWAGWGWRVAIIPTRTPMPTQRDTRAGVTVEELRALVFSWADVDAATARSLRELADGLEGDGYARLADTPPDWTYDAASRDVRDQNDSSGPIAACGVTFRR